MNLSAAKKALEAGQLVAIPTETVYGLAANALNEEAVLEIFRVKNRPAFDPLIVHVASWEQARSLTQGVAPEVLAQAERLAKAHWPGPLTLLLQKSPEIPDLVTSGLPRVALRVPAHPLTLELLQMLDFPLAAPSANPFGYISPTRTEHVQRQLGDRIAGILDGGACRVGVESTILGFEQGRPVIYRKGGLSVEVIETLIGPVKVRAQSSSKPATPGMLKSHYAPRTPLVLGDLRELAQKYSGQRAGVLAFRQMLPGLPESRQRLLSPKGDLAEAAQRLFAAMHELDAMGLDVILAELLPEEGLGRAVNDRLRRASK
ncbi:MAG TPA: threonylcarbamoyl-AMP synthase [Phaeodactylibacter sp.]|nr:threonylcarbamoyl-AMP synthase [Phaeodactylibacter sp.]